MSTFWRCRTLRPTTQPGYGFLIQPMRKPDAYREIGDAADQRSATFEAPGTDRARHRADVGSEQQGRAWLRAACPICRLSWSRSVSRRSFDVLPESPINGRFAATVIVVDHVLDAASGTFGVRLELPNPGYKIPAGVNCKIRFLSAEVSPPSKPLDVVAKGSAVAPSPTLLGSLSPSRMDRR